MTFTLTLINRHGIWQSSDLRLTDPRSGASVDEYSCKHVALRCADGSALLTYAGLGRVHGVHLSDWLREFLRGENRSLDQTVQLIRQRASEDLGRVARSTHHMFVIG